MLSITETLEIQRGLKKLETKLHQSLHYTHDGDGMLLPAGPDKIYHAVLDWMEENINQIEFKPQKVETYEPSLVKRECIARALDESAEQYLKEHAHDT